MATLHMPQYALDGKANNTVFVVTFFVIEKIMLELFKENWNL